MIEDMFLDHFVPDRNGYTITKKEVTMCKGEGELSVTG